MTEKPAGSAGIGGLLFAIVAVVVLVIAVVLAIRAVRKPPAEEAPPAEVETLAPAEPAEESAPPLEEVESEAEKQAALVAAGAAALAELQQQVLALAAASGLEETAEITLQVPAMLAGTELAAGARELPLQLTAAVDFSQFLNLLESLETEFAELRVSDINMVSEPALHMVATCVFPSLDPAVMTAYVASLEPAPIVAAEPEPVEALLPEAEIDPTALVQEKPIPVGTIQRALALKGIMGDEARRSAIVDGAVVKAGDSFMTMVDGRTCALQVLEIKAAPPTVILRYQGETFPLVLDGAGEDEGTK
jgi:hypothetical protein